MLATLLGMFASRDAGVINGARFQTDGDGRDVLVTPEDVVLRPEANPHLLQGGAGQVNAAVALGTLKRNKWIEVQCGDGKFRITLGERADERSQGVRA